MKVSHISHSQKSTPLGLKPITLYAGSQRLIETRLTRWLGLKSRASRALVSLPSSSIFHPRSCARTQPLESGSRSVLLQCLIHLPSSILRSYSTP
ncbi:BZ3500_MvSof-1268-A1-R1_Chr10-2g02962 [Microbotryum saponariae]|uniref:BZ3500_MvSof-1268-A1-R1_Chr10-2g02962 protein n=1 Tax=Microbotryum saponariae TaxID=289078 RepID=A0A2X0K7E6_9BASI|nr:BZ3501_MvSof-1269-A2-R1_Chr10-2g02548 [Microbotryum saponariae]SDA01828.1 BZ3500_MvSof-1268-A1-R1_Chr10-2g02962 [Microbotryum saponariae]